MNNGNKIIAGVHGGKKVDVVPAYQNAFAELKKYELRGNYWAGQAVRGLESLTSGIINRNDVFVRPGARMMFGQEIYYMILPGIKATVEHRPNDRYVVASLVVDSTYFDSAEGQKTGLYKVRKEAKRWEPQYIENGILKDLKDSPYVAISDGNYKNINDAVKKVTPMLGNAPGASGGGFNQYDMHYTHGKDKLGGLLNYRKATNPLSNMEIEDSSNMLAYTMLQAKNTENVTWVSVNGGSAVLTQAMKKLSSLGVTLPNHFAYFVNPTTAPRELVKQANAIGLQMEKKTMSAEGLNFIAVRDRLGLVYDRWKTEEDYKFKHAVFNSFDTGTAIYGVGTTAAAAAGIFFAAPAVPALVTIGKITGIVASGGVLAKVGTSLAKTASPDSYAALVERIKS